MAEADPIPPGNVTGKDLDLLRNKLRELNAEWEQFGIHLKLPFATIQEIRDTSNRLTADQKMERVLDMWKQQGNKTWNEIYDAVIKLQDIELAERIKKRHPNLDSKVLVDDDDYTKKMMILLKGVIPRWESFGLGLGIDYNDLQKIDEGKLTAGGCMTKLLATWIRMKGGKATIYEIIQACKTIGNLDLAERLQDDDDIKKQLKIDGVCKIFYEKTHNTWKTYVVIAKADKEKMLIARYKDPKFDEGPKMIIGFSGDELSLHYTTGYISGWKVEEPTPLKVKIDSGQLCTFIINLACEVSGCSPLTLEVEITGVKPPNNTFTIKRNSFVYNSPVTIPSKRLCPHD